MHFAKPSESSPSSTLNPAQMQSLLHLVTKRGEAALSTWADPPAMEVNGAMLYATRGCMACHTVNGSGNRNAPVLNGLAGRRSKQWVMGHFGDPKKFSPNSQMPAYKFNPQELEAITAYVMAIPK
jgi:cbb3-type cytochrome oxidase cytochrome c subunit